MKKLKTYIDKLKKATPTKQKDVVRKILEGNAKYMIDLVKNQLMHGVDANDAPLKAYQSKSYAAFKKTLNPLGVTDLRLKGGFHKGIYVKIDGKNQTKFGSTDSKTKDLTARYGNVLNLNQQSKEKLIKERLQPAVIRWYKNLYKF